MNTTNTPRDLHALPLKTRQELARLQLLAEVARNDDDACSARQWLHYLAAINAGDEECLALWLNAAEESGGDALEYLSGAPEYFAEVAGWPLAAPAKKTRAQELAEQLGLEDWEAEQLAQELGDA